MIDATEVLLPLLAGVTWERYQADRTLQLVAERTLEIVGEAAKNIPDDYRKLHPELPWKRMVGQRNVISHEYGQIKQEKIWLVVSSDLPRDLVRLKELLAAFPL
jgi:uncharacterized protein with HEPN domain